MASQHWGEFEPAPPPMEALRPEELKQLTKLQPSIVVEGPKLFQPAEPQPEQDQTGGGAFCIDPMVLVTIQLECQNAALSQALAQKSAVDDSVLMPISISDECFEKLEESFNVFPEVKDSDFIRGQGPPIPEIQPEMCRDLLIRSVGALAAHTGFNVSTDLALGTLADATGNFLRSLCLMLRQTRDAELERGPHGFVDALERTFVDSGLGSIRHLAGFYSTSVVDRLRQVRDTNYQLRAEYDQLASERESVENIALEDSLQLVDILAETPTGLSSVGPGGTIDMSAYPNMSFESADDLAGMNSSLDSEEIVVQASPLQEVTSPANKKMRT